MVLNDSPLIAAATKARVQAAIQKLGYVYDRAAGNLRNKRSRIVGVSICNLVNPYFADVTAGLQEALEDLGRVLVLGNCAESVRSEEHTSELQSLMRISYAVFCLKKKNTGTYQISLAHTDNFSKSIIILIFYIHYYVL